MHEDLLLSEGGRLVHIGPHKTGTTAIQVAMFQARARLSELGVNLPGRTRRPRQASAALFAAAREGRLDQPIPAWDKLVEEVAASPNRVCVSDEQFGKSPREIAGKIVEDLGGERVHVVALARRYDTYLPSQWQERVKSGRPESFDEWLRIVFGADQEHYEHSNVWTAHDTVGLVRRWLEFVDPDRFTLVIADESDREQQPRLFEGFLGLPEGTLQLVPDRSNQSVALANLELIRAANRAVTASGVARADYRPMLRAMVRTITTSEQARVGLRPLLLPDWVVPRIQELSEARVEAVKGLPIRVIGDPEHLRAGPMSSGDAEQGELAVSAELAGRVVARCLEVALDRSRQQQA